MARSSISSSRACRRPDLDANNGYDISQTNQAGLNVKRDATENLTFVATPPVRRAGSTRMARDDFTIKFGGNYIDNRYI
ncbi:hypothetical protein M529_00910 [Sphingobium ummariense RL-3]|uniref:Uncharacterized protein n=1 Tax=Sphingobium ummariense RL-3 TaxID=1346791 RepID=T0J8C7_9SPHN|nr:hypothetical protein M529_00910 [Sphingobium ummariense RL-3]